MSSSTGITDSGNSTISFDGDNVLCQVCGDKSSGFHYGVHACEGCKGFFRRSIQQKLQYRPCTNKDEQQRCSILRVNRNRCQYCRLKKCIAVGMSRDAVRFGRVPKREKVKLLAEMQKANSHCQMIALTVEMNDGHRTVEAIVSAHFETCDFTKAKADKFLGRDERRNSSRVACPLNPRVPDEGNAEELTERYSPAIRGVVNFAKSIPGFHVLCQEDQITLLKAGVFEVLLLRLVRLFDFGKEQVVLLDGSVYQRESRRTGCHGNGIQGQGYFLVDSLFDFAERFNSFDLTDAEIALFCAYVLISPDRTGLRNPEVIRIMNLRLKQLLLAVLQNQNADHCHGNQSNGERCYSGKQLLDTLISKVQDLRTLSTLHSEKLLAFKTESHQHNKDTLSNPPQSLCNSDLSKGIKMSHPDINSVPRLTIGANSDSGKGASPAACSDSSDSSDASSGSVGSGNRKRRITDCMPNLKRALLTPACDAFVARDIRARHAALTALLERPAEHRATPYGDAYASIDATTVAFRQWWLNGSSLILPQGLYYGATPPLAFTPEIAVAASSCPSKSVVYDEDQPLNLSKKILPVKC